MKKENKTIASVSNSNNTQAQAQAEEKTQAETQATATASTQEKIYFTLKTINGVKCCLIGNKCYKLQRVETSPYIKVKTEFSECYHLTITADQMKNLDTNIKCEHIVNNTGNKTTRVTRHASHKGLESYLFNAIDQIKNASNFFEVGAENEQKIIDHFDGVEELEQTNELRKSPPFKLMQAYKILSELYEQEKARKQAEEKARQELLIEQEYNSIIEQFKRFNITYNKDEILSTIKAKYTNE